LETILNDIDQGLLETFAGKGLKAYGYCELVTKDDKPNPVTCTLKQGEKRESAQIHDKWNGIFYHRLLNSFPAQDDEEFSFGNRISKRFSLRVRTVLAHKVQLGENFFIDFFNAFPDKMTISGYKFVFLSQGTIIADHEGVYNQEYGDQSYNKHRTAWNIFAFEYDLEFIKC